MSKSLIEWTDYSLNPIKGKCPVACNYCYARRMYDRFKWDPEIRFVPSVYNSLPKKPCKVFVGSTMELFLFDDWMEFILNKCQDFPQHTFQFLTKFPKKLVQWSPFPDNCWVGVTVDTYDRFMNSTFLLGEIEAKVRFISFEPLLEQMFISPMYIAHLDWVIIGQQTPIKKVTMPKKEWIQEIVETANKANIPVFLKDNLKPLFGGIGKLWAFNNRMTLRQEIPE